MQCHVFIQEDGERSIVMAPASTSIMDAQAVQEYFGRHSYESTAAVIRTYVGEDIEKHASMVTTEISQVPLSGVLALLKAARCVHIIIYHSLSLFHLMLFKFV